jgi:hypothetical protein
MQYWKDALIQEVVEELLDLRALVVVVEEQNLQLEVVECVDQVSLQEQKVVEEVDQGGEGPYYWMILQVQVVQEGEVEE